MLNRRHQKSFLETYNRVVDGMIGDIVAARSYSLRGQLWYREPERAAVAIVPRETPRALAARMVRLLREPQEAITHA